MDLIKEENQLPSTDIPSSPQGKFFAYGVVDIGQVIAELSSSETRGLHLV